MFLFSLLGCDPGDLGLRDPPPDRDPVPDSASPADTAETDPTRDATGDTGTLDTGTPPPPPTLVEVSHERELRAVWIATVSNINWPSAQGLSMATQQAELLELLDVAAEAGLNAVVFQVRPEADAFYDSALEPWSRYLTGTQGQDPGWDPLEFLVEEGHARGLEVHAWFNPYRAKANNTSVAASNHVSVTFSSYAYPYGTALWMDPGAPAVQDHTVAVITDVVSRYDIDGVHFDDYFYPYPNGTDFPDDATYAAYGGGLALDDWRRDNVNRLVERISEAVATTNPSVRFGISPFGIYRPGQPPGITGLDQYAEIFADPVLWKEEGWVDYLAPQLYWPSTQTAQAYEPLLDWWSALPEDGRYTFVGNALYQLGTTSSWTLDEYRTQLALSRDYIDQGSLGNIWYHIGALQDNVQGIRDIFRDEFYPTPALPPPLFERQDDPVDPPTLIPGADGVVQVSHADARWWVIYAERKDGWQIDRIVSAEQPEVVLEPGRWAISAAGRHGVESLGVLVEIP